MSRARFATVIFSVVSLGALLTDTPATAADDPMTFGAMEVGDTIPAADILDGGLQKYDKKDYAAASLEFYKIVSAGGEDIVRFRHKAEYMMGRALYQMGYYQSALGYFDRVVETGADHKYFKATHKMLYLIFKKLGDPAIVEKIAQYEAADFDERFRDDFLFTVGKFHYEQGNLDQSLRLLRSIKSTSKHYAKAKYLEGILWVRKNQAKPAVESFKEILRKVAADPGSVKDPALYERLANLSLARIFYSTEQFDLSIKYYDKVPPESEEWVPAMYESAWSFFQKDRFARALGNLHTLDSPYFADTFFPESDLLRSVIYFTTCNYKLVRETIEEFMAVYPPLREKVESYLAQYEDPAEFWSFLVDLNKQSGGEYDARTTQVFNAAFSDRKLARADRYIRRVDAELKALQAAKGTWGRSDLAAKLVGDVNVVRALAVNDSGTVAWSRLERVVKDLRSIISQIRKVKFETANAEMGQLEGKLAAEQTQSADVRGASGTDTDDEHVYWPFDTEYWKDELGSYVYAVENECGR